MWLLVLEKAWAKIHGSYAAMISGHAHQAIRDLTGAPSYDININDEGMF